MKRAPQEKKVLDYLNDRRNAYGESDKGSRKNIPRSKAIRQRAFRSRVRQLLRSTNPSEAGDAAATARREVFNKTPDRPLVDHIYRPNQTKPVPGEPSELQREAMRRNRRRR